MREADGYCRRLGKYINAMKAACHDYYDRKEVATAAQHVADRKPETKVCKKCGRLLPLDQFPKHNTSRDGHDGLCVDCKRERMAAANAKRLQRKAEAAGLAAGYEAPEGMRRCVKCGRTLPVSEFGVCSRRKDGMQYECKDCRNRYGRELYHKTSGGVERPELQRNPEGFDPIHAFTDAEIVGELRRRGWTVTCTKEI